MAQDEGLARQGSPRELMAEIIDGEGVDRVRVDPLSDDELGHLGRAFNAMSGAIQRDRILFRNDHGNFEVGLWDTEPIDTELSPFPWHEFCQVLDGEVTISAADRG